jgi:hypothetical protein
MRQTFSIILSLILLQSTIALGRPVPGSTGPKAHKTVVEIPADTWLLSRFKTTDAKMNSSTGRIESEGSATCSLELPARWGGQSLALALQGKVEKGSLIVSLTDEKGNFRKELVELHGPVGMEQKYSAFIPTGKIFLKLELAKGTVVQLKPIKVSQFQTN